jgi:diguanylate cyclase (GGDEF)-like protein
MLLDSTWQVPLGFLLGMLVALALYNIQLFFLLRQQAYALYALSLFAMVAHEALPRTAVLNFLVYGGLVTAFTRSFLELKHVSKRLDRFVIVTFGLLALDTAGSILATGRLVTLDIWRVLNPLAIGLNAAALLAAGVLAQRRGIVAARAYVIGSAGALVGLLVAEAATCRLLPIPLWASLAAPVGAVWQALFLALAVAARIRFAEREAARLTEFAYRDPLTGIANRRAFDEALAREWRRGGRNLKPLTLLIFDIDHFKAYNDRYGHQQGDVALRMVALEIERAARRPGDFAARYGGEEFALVLGETTLDGGLVTAEAVRRAVRELGLENVDGPLTISIGCATIVPGEHEHADALIALADRALYDAKESGRDRTVVAASGARAGTVGSA